MKEKIKQELLQEFKDRFIIKMSTWVDDLNLDKETYIEKLQYNQDPYELFEYMTRKIDEVCAKTIIELMINVKNEDFVKTVMDTLTNKLKEF